jgi:hypothetical protein
MKKFNKSLMAAFYINTPYPWRVYSKDDQWMPETTASLELQTDYTLFFLYIHTYDTV